MWEMTHSLLLQKDEDQIAVESWDDGSACSQLHLQRSVSVAMSAHSVVYES